MVAKVNLARQATATAGTGTMTLGGAPSGWFTLAEAGVADGETVRYRIDDGNDREIGVGTYTASGTTLSRDTVSQSKIAGVAGTSKINLSGAAVVTVIAGGEDFVASEIAFTPAGDIAAATVQAAIEEVDSEKLAKSANLSDVASAATTFGNIKQAATDAATGVVEKATQAEMEAETADKYPDAAILKHHPGIVKVRAYVTISGGTPSIASSYGLSSITDNSASLITFSFSTAFSASNNYTGIAMTHGNAARGYAVGHTKNAGAYAVASYSDAGSGVEPTNGWEFMAVGDQ